MPIRGFRKKNPKSVTVKVYMTEEEYAKIKEAAKKNNISISRMIMSPHRGGAQQ